MNFENPKVGIIGGTGKMGSCFADLLERCGLQVLRTGRKTDLIPDDMARQCDVTVISVPIADTVRVIQETGPLIRRKALLMDLTSIKKGPMDAMLKYSRAEVVGAHPLFGPEEKTMAGLRMAVCPGRGEKGLKWLTGILEKSGITTVSMDPLEHDRIMGLIQGVNHFTTLALAQCISRSGLNLEVILDCATQTFKQKIDRIRSMLRQQTGLFRPLLMDNPPAGEFMDRYIECSGDLVRIIKEKDRKSFEEIFEILEGFFYGQKSDPQ